MKKSLFEGETQFGGFDKLMPHRVRRVLLVASPYDSAIIAEDDRLTEIIFSEYLDLNLRYAPQVTRVATAESALDKIQQESFDVVITMMRVGNMDINAFANSLKSLAPQLPLVLLAYNSLDIQGLQTDYLSPIDYIFLWNGDPKILLSIIKLIEDRRNIDHDIATASVQAIILIEDSVRFYSAYLPLIYTELMKQTQYLIAESVNLSHKLLRMRARPKILLATSYEEALELYSKYRKNMLGLITDIQFPHAGKADPEAGIQFAAMLKREMSDMPVLVQSSDARNFSKAAAIGASFLNKASPSMLQDLLKFIQDNFGFGDFVFHMPDGTEVGRAKDLHSLLNFLKTAPIESVVYHANRNHFSKWLMARTEFEIAYSIRPIGINEFSDPEGLRSFLINTVSSSLRKTQKGVVVEFSKPHFDMSIPFVKIGSGSLGGKARGLAFLNNLISKPDFPVNCEGAKIAIPNLAVLSTDVFDTFLEQNGLRRLLAGMPDDKTIANLFLEAEFPAQIKENLGVFIDKVRYPLSVRSSSVMEDSQAQPFAGIYATYLLPNNHPDSRVRLQQLSAAVKMVFASTFFKEARSYRGATLNLRDEEKMAVIIQRLIGRRHEDRFYPAFSGVAQSHNFYPLPPIKPEDGIAHVALGLGKTVVEGYRSLRFSPAHPGRLHQFSNSRDYVANSQQEFKALDLGVQDYHPGYDSGSNILTLGLKEAEKDGELAPLASTYSPDNDRIYEGLGRSGPRIVTFAPVLESNAFPLAKILKFLLDLGVQAMGCQVEMEFAVDMQSKEFYILQMRPLSTLGGGRVDLSDIDRAKLICHSPKTLGHGIIKEISDLIYIKPKAFNTAKTPEIAAEIEELNDRLRGESRRYALIGPGRWGSSDPWLGVPVKWGQISNARIIVETTLPGFVVDPSYGSHFLHNVVSLGIGYFILNHLKNEGSINWAALDAAPAVSETRYLRHIRLASALDIRINSRTGEGAILFS